MILLDICIPGSCWLSVGRGNILGRKHTRVMIMIPNEVGGTDMKLSWKMLDKYVLFIVYDILHPPTTCPHTFPGKEGAKGCGV